jgi:glutathione S-transferase
MAYAIKRPMILTPTLYSFRRCPYAMRARLAVLISGQEFVLHEVSLRAKPAAMVAASPKGTVPVLVLPNGTVIDESLDIMLWALRLHDPEHWLTGHDAALIAQNDGPFKYHLDRYKYAPRYDCDPVPHRAAALEILREWDKRIGIAGQFCSELRSITDMAIMPFVRQFAATDRAWFDAQDLPQFHQWLAYHEASTLFARIMAKPTV